MEIFALTLLLGWTFAGWAGFRWGGYSDQVIWRRHPAAACADFALSGHRFMEMLAAGLVTAVCVAAILLLPELAGLLCAGVILFLLIPLPYYFFDAARRDHRMRSFEYVHFNVLRPPTTNHAREVVDGLLVEAGTKLAFFISDRQWEKIKYISDTEKKYLAGFMVAPGLYVAKATNDLLQIFDSLNLYDYTVNPENVEALDAFKTALKDVADLKSRLAAMSRLVESATAAAPPPKPATVVSKPRPTPPPEPEAQPAPSPAVVAEVAKEPALPLQPAEPDDVPLPEEIIDPEPALAATATLVDQSDEDLAKTIIPPDPLPDPLPRLPDTPGFSRFVSAVNLPETRRGGRPKTPKKKKADPGQVSLDMGSAAAPTPPANTLDWKPDL
jgi:hypothetical protein